MKPLVCLAALILASVAFAQQPAEPKTTPGVSVIHFVAPVYPPIARSARIQGDVRLHLIVSRAGKAENMQVISGHPMLNQAAMDAVKQWKFGLARPDQDVDFQVVIRFRMLSMNADRPTNRNDFVMPELPDRVTVWGEDVGYEVGDCGPLPRRRALQCLFLWRCKPVPYQCW